jgi:Rrf2 family protein
MANNCRFAFAVHVLSVMATHEGEAVSSELLARSANTNPVVIRRLLGELREAGLVQTTRGPNGGAQLAKPAQEISLLAVYHAAAGQVEPFGSHPNEPGKGCCVGREIKRVLEGVADRARTAVEKEYAATSLAQVVSEMQSPIES